MKRFDYFVNLLFSPCFTRHLHASFSEGANYSPEPYAVQGLFFASIRTPLRPAGKVFTSSALLCSLSQGAGVTPWL